MEVSSRYRRETERIAAVNQLQILDTPAESDFDNIVALASLICEAPIAIISFEDKKRCWFKAKTGIDIVEIARDIAFFANDYGSDGILIIPDAREDSDTCSNAWVTGDLNIRFFASLQLINEDGDVLGHLIVMDRKPRVLSDQQLCALRMLASQVVALLKLRLQVNVQKNIKEAENNGAEQINTIFQNAIDAVVVVDSIGHILQWNPKAVTIFGWKNDEVIGKYFHETIIPERYRAAHLKRMKRYENISDETTPNKTMEIRALRKNNSEFDIALGISPTTLNGQRFFILFASDITERKLATAKLDKQKEFYENILNSLPTDIAVFDPDHTYLFVNPGAISDEKLRQYIVGKDDFQYCEYRNRDRSIAQKRRDQFLEVKKAGKEIRWEDTIRDAAGNPITHLRRLFPVHDENGTLTMVIGFGIDITDRKIMEEKQTALVKQLSAQNTQLIDFCNIVSHNLRAPLVNMGMLVKFIEETADEEERKMLISKLDPVIENLNTTFNELVESIQIKQDLEIKYEHLLLSDCLQRTIEGFETEINNSKAEIVADFTLAPKIFCPQKYLFSIFHNLVSNSLKYQSPKRRPVIKIKSEKTDGNIVLSVSDNGLGIDLEKHKEHFFKIGKVFHRHPNAKGFGLFMTKTQVEAMNGQIWVESTPDEGSTFFVAFKNQDR